MQQLTAAVTLADVVIAPRICAVQLLYMQTDFEMLTVKNMPATELAARLRELHRVELFIVIHEAGGDAGCALATQGAVAEVEAADMEGFEEALAQQSGQKVTDWAPKPASDAGLPNNIWADQLDVDTDSGGTEIRGVSDQIRISCSRSRDL